MHIGRLVKILNTAIQKDMNRRLAEFDLTGGQGIILGYLAHHQEGEICQKHLEQEFELSHPTMSSILSRMEEKDLIVTSPLEKDKRYKKVAISEKGIALDKQVFTYIEDMEAQLASDLTEEEKSQVIEILQKMIRNIS